MYLECLIVDWVQRLSGNVSLPLGALAVVGEEVGLDVGIWESVAVGSRQISGSVHVDVQHSVPTVVARDRGGSEVGRETHDLLDAECELTKKFDYFASVCYACWPNVLAKLLSQKSCFSQICSCKRYMWSNTLHTVLNLTSSIYSSSTYYCNSIELRERT